MNILSPKLDVVFKHLFTSADSKDILTDFLASVLDIDPEDITNITILNTELAPEIVDHKYSRLDLLIEVEGRLINVEIQVKPFSDYRERTLFYWAKVFTMELKRGQTYKDLKQTISINILDYNMFDCEECHSIFQLREVTRNELLTDKCRFDFLELPKASTDSRQIKRLRRWLNFFNLKSEGDADMIAQANDEVMNKAVFILKQMSADEKMQEIARIRERALHDEASYIADATAKGRAEGRAEGIEEGMAKGIAEGMNTIIFKMREAGMTEDAIQSIINR